MKEKVQFGGRTYEPIGATTAAHDFWIMGHIRASGLAEAVQRPGESPEEFANRLVYDLATSDRAFIMLGGLLVPEGTPTLGWTPEMAEETARYLGTLTDPLDKNKLIAKVAELMVVFFRNGLLSFTTSAASSPGAARDVATNSSDSEAT